MTPIRAKSVLNDRGLPWSSRLSSHLKVFPRYFCQFWQGGSWSLSKGIGLMWDRSRSVWSHRYFLFLQVHDLMWYCPSKIQGRRWSHVAGSLLARATAQFSWESLYGEKWLEWSQTSPKYIRASVAQPCDRIMDLIKASKACNSQRDLAKTARKESDHRDIASRSKIDRGQV